MGSMPPSRDRSRDVRGEIAAPPVQRRAHSDASVQGVKAVAVSKPFGFATARVESGVQAPEWARSTYFLLSRMDLKQPKHNSQYRERHCRHLRPYMVKKSFIYLFLFLGFFNAKIT